MSVTIISKITYLFVPSHPQPDELVWGLTADGVYSVKSGALLTQGLTHSSTPKVPYDWIWKLQVPPKVKNFLWKACNDGLPTKSLLEKSHVFLPQECVFFCNYQSESTTHLCFQCPFTRDVFSHLLVHYDWPPLPDWTPSLLNLSFTDLFIHSRELLQRRELSLFAIAWWYIWYCRNNLIFRDESVSHMQAAGLIAQFVNNWFKSSLEEVSSGAPISLRQWSATSRWEIRP